VSSVITFKIDSSSSLTKEKSLAREIGNLWQRWDQDRREYTKLTRAVIQQIYAVNTKGTSHGSKLPHRNKTTTPKLAQIRDTLSSQIANSLFSRVNYFTFVGSNDDSAARTNEVLMDSIARTKFEQSGFEIQLKKGISTHLIPMGSLCVRSYYVDERHTADGQLQEGYVGGKIDLISPLDIVFDLQARSFDESVKVVRSVVPVGAFIKEVAECKYGQGIDIEKIKGTLKGKEVSGSSVGMYSTELEEHKRQIFKTYGHEMRQDLQDGRLVEVLEFHGSWMDDDFNMDNRIDRRILVLNRSVVLTDQPLGQNEKLFFHTYHEGVGNLLPPGPLAMIYGLQYRLDHMENRMEDMWDQLAAPHYVERGSVRFTDRNGNVDGDRTVPGGKYNLTDADSGVDIIRPPVNLAEVNIQTEEIARRMEAMAAAPGDLMGIKTAGRQTATQFSAQRDSANTNFFSRVRALEEGLVEKLINHQVELYIKNFSDSDTIEILNEEKAREFRDIKKSDLTVRGKFKAKGSKYLARRNEQLDILAQLQQAGVMQMITPHVSSIKLAEFAQFALGEDELDIVQPYVSVHESKELASLQQAAQDELEEERTQGLDDVVTPEEEQLTQFTEALQSQQREQGLDVGTEE